jgi:hypothetical protein
MSVHDSPSAPRDYHVVLPQSGLSLEKVGLYERYSIKLIGRIDQHWEHCYERIVAGSPSLSRFWLDSDTASISFPCSATDGPGEVMATLKVLEGLLERVSRDASFLLAKSGEAEPRRGWRATIQHRRAARRPSLSKDRRRLGGTPPVGRERRHQRERRQQRARFFLIERRRGKGYAYRQFVLLALLAGAILAVL